ncbi:MAG: HAD family hydrolase [Calditrichia bacterium]
MSRLDKRVAHISDTDAALGISANPFAKLDNIFISDIDDTLIGDDDALKELAGLIRNRRSGMGFGVATGRPVSSAKQVLAEHNVPLPDVIISSVGSEIYYGKDQHIDKGWRAHINERWDRKKIVSLLRPLKFLDYQDGEDAQRDYKISYFMDENPDHLAMVHKVLTENRIRYTLIFRAACFWIFCRIARPKAKPFAI